MAETTVKQLAEAVGTPVDRLLQQMQEAGLPQTAESDAVQETQKESLLAFLKKSHGEETDGPKKITLKRRTLSTIKAGGSAGRGRTVNVEVRKSELMSDETRLQIPLNQLKKLRRSKKKLRRLRLKPLKRHLKQRRQLQARH